MLNLNYKKFVRSYNRNYDYLYEHEVNDNLDCHYLCEFHDTLMENNTAYHEVAVWFCNKRYDFLSSDRECAAFFLTFVNECKKEKCVETGDGRIRIGIQVDQEWEE